MAAHETDADCEPHLVDDTCTVCGVGRVDPCPECGRYSYHAEKCPETGYNRHED